MNLSELLVRLSYHPWQLYILFPQKVAHTRIMVGHEPTLEPQHRTACRQGWIRHKPQPAIKWIHWQHCCCMIIRLSPVHWRIDYNFDEQCRIRNDSLNRMSIHGPSCKWDALLGAGFPTQEGISHGLVPFIMLFTSYGQSTVRIVL